MKYHPVGSAESGWNWRESAALYALELLELFLSAVTSLSEPGSLEAIHAHAVPFLLQVFLFPAI